MKKTLVLITLVATSLVFGACSSTSKCPLLRTKAAKAQTCGDACCAN